MKKTDLDKNKALRLLGDLRATATPARFGRAAAAAPERRAQRKLDQAAGLVSFPVKLRQPVIDSLRARAAATNEPINTLLDKLLTEALGLAHVD
jgi:hypothetical protein